MKDTLLPPGKAAAANDPEAAELDAKFSPRSEGCFLRLQSYQSRNRLSDEQLGKRLGSNGTYVSRYRNNKFLGDISEFEGRAEQLLAREELMDGDEGKLSDKGFCVEPVNSFLNLVRNQRMMGVGYGPAGRGKSKACQLYAAAHKGTIYLHVNAWATGRDRVIDDIARIAGVRRAKSDKTMTDSLLRVLRDSDRLLIIDNAQRLTESGRKWLADFHDATRIGIALVGNPEIEEQFLRNDQHASRLGRCVDVTAITDAKTTVLHLLKSYLPDALEDKATQAEALAILRLEDGGAARAVKMHLRLATKIREGSPQTTPAEAVKLARTQLVHKAA